jgi:hypothetical protein
LCKHHAANEIWPMVMQRTVILPKCGVQMFNYFTLDATVPPRRSPAGVRTFDLPRFGRLSRPYVASNSIPSSILDTPHFHTWRPIPSHPLFWTPCPSLSGVHPSNLLIFGRLPFSCVASNSIQSSILDAMSITLWRPSFQPSQFWTPVTSIRGVQFHPILYSGRHVHHSLASILTTFSILDACHVHTWRPIPSHPLFWTPCPSLSGVHSSNFLYSGRLPFPFVASNSISSSVPDAMSITLWRPSFQPSQFWTPLTSLRGVQFHPILYSGRHVHHSLASILPTFSILDAPHFHTWRPIPSLP